MAGDARETCAELVDIEDIQEHTGTESLLPDSTATKRPSSSAARRWTLRAGGFLLVGVTVALLRVSSGPVRQGAVLESEVQELYANGTKEVSGEANDVDNATAEGSTTTAEVTTTTTLSTQSTTSTTLNKTRAFEKSGCAKDEELFNSLCYKKCKLLTHGRRAIRVGPQACCRKEPCEQGGHTQMGTTFSLNSCTGFNVCGDYVENGGCPHSPGHCRDDEEQMGGLCYKSCKKLTKGRYPNRVAAATCCKKRGSSCMLPWNVKTDSSFSAGGGDPCADDEEMFQQSCYKKCGLLAGRYKYRTGPATCCTKDSATRCLWPSNYKTRTAFNVAGGGAGCPEGEEDFAHMCYKKCSILTNGDFPYRSASSTCCKTTGTDCMWASNIITLPEYAKGSGLNPAGHKRRANHHHAVKN
mmetsp:Transcript_45369/g.131352  ORF Transcript_45369/g.131352 Transcript_45369/m.131352 type:complete len:412 (-) Transcript_45369:105-1340(-)